MISQYDDLTGRGDAIQNFLKMIKEKNNEDGKFKGILERMSPTTKKVENFLRGNQQTEFMGGQMMAHDYDEDPYLRKTIMEIINTPGYDSDTVKEAKRQLKQMNLGLPRFPKA